MKFSTLVEQLGVSPVSTSLASHAILDPEVEGVASIVDAEPGTLSFIDGGRSRAQIRNTLASGLILPRDETLQATAVERGIAWMSTREPRLLFARTIALFYEPWSPGSGVHPLASVDPSVCVDGRVSIASHATVHAGVTLGDDVCLHAGVVVYPNARIGARSVIHANATIHERTWIGEDCVVHSGAVIGAEGFGFVRTEGGWHKMPQSGRVVMEDRVEIGCNSAVDRPAVGETRLGRGTKIDNLVQVGHGCTIGSDCVLAGQVGLAGRVQLGDGVILAGQVGIADQVTVGDGAVVTAKTGVSGDVAANAIVSGGLPEMPTARWRRMSIVARRLPEIYRALKKIQNERSSSHGAEPVRTAPEG